AGTILLLGLTTMNFLLTTVIAILLGRSGYNLQREAQPRDQPAVEEQEGAATSAMQSPENAVNILSIDPTAMESGYALIPLVDASQGGDLLDRIVMIRKQLAIELGIVIPVVRVRDNIQLHPNEYRLRIRGNEVASGELMLDHYLAMAPDMDADDGIE